MEKHNLRDFLESEVSQTIRTHYDHIIELCCAFQAKETLKAIYELEKKENSPQDVLKKLKEWLSEQHVRNL